MSSSEEKMSEAIRSAALTRDGSTASAEAVEKTELAFRWQKTCAQIAIELNIGTYEETPGLFYNNLKKRIHLLRLEEVRKFVDWWAMNGYECSLAAEAAFQVYEEEQEKELKCDTW